MYFGGLGGFGGLDHRGILSALISMLYIQPMCIIHIYVIKTSGPGGGLLATLLPKHFFANLDVNNNDNFFCLSRFFISLAPDFQFASDATVL